MPVTVIVEDGSLVPAANSFVSVADVVQYCGDRGYAFDVTDPDAAARAVIRGGDWMRNTVRLTYRGSLITATQTMPWPRTGASYYRGPDIPVNLIPPCVKDAQCEVIYRTRAGTNLQPDLAHGGRIKSVKVDGAVEREYFPDAPSETVIQAAMGILSPVLLNGHLLLAQPFQAVPVDKSPYLPGQFDNPPPSYPDGTTPSSS